MFTSNQFIIFLLIISPFYVQAGEYSFGPDNKFGILFGEKVKTRQVDYYGSHPNTGCGMLTPLKEDTLRNFAEENLELRFSEATVKQINIRKLVEVLNRSVKSRRVNYSYDEGKKHLAHVRGDFFELNPQLMRIIPDDLWVYISMEFNKRTWESFAVRLTSVAKLIDFRDQCEVLRKAPIKAYEVLKFYSNSVLQITEATFDGRSATAAYPYGKFNLGTSRTYLDVSMEFTLVNDRTIGVKLVGSKATDVVCCPAVGVGTTENNP